MPMTERILMQDPVCRPAEIAMLDDHCLFGRDPAGFSADNLHDPLCAAVDGAQKLEAPAPSSSTPQVLVTPT